MKNKPFYMMVAICIGAFISHFTAGVVNVSLPYLSNIFHTILGTVQWITIGYLLVIASSLPIMGSLGDRFGHRLIHNLGFIGSVVFPHPLSPVGVIIILAFIGLGMGLIASPNNSFIMQHVPIDFVGAIGGIIALTRNLGMVPRYTKSIII
ncbi:MFS transporter [Bacillus sp. Bva_UNVM-123]